MIETKNKNVQIYKTKFTFQQLLSFLQVLANEESEAKKKDKYIVISLRFILDGNKTYSTRSFADFINNTADIETIKQRKVIGFSFSLGSVFSIYAGEDHFYIDYSSTDKAGQHLFSNAKDILKLRVNSIPFALCKNKYFFFFMMSLTILSILNLIETEAHIFYSLSVSSLFLLIFIGSVSTFGKAKIIMENKNDSFLIRNKDSIIISVIFTIVGFLLGSLSCFNIKI